MIPLLSDPLAFVLRQSSNLSVFSSRWRSERHLWSLRAATPANHHQLQRGTARTKRFDCRSRLTISVTSPHADPHVQDERKIDPKSYRACAPDTLGAG